MSYSGGGSDEVYVAGSGDFVFNTTKDADTTYTVSVSENPDGQTCTITNPTGTIDGLSNTVLAVTCNDDNAEDEVQTVILSQNNSTLAESTSSIDTITATLSGTASSDVTVSLSFSGTATLTSDYTRSDTEITIPAGSTTGSITITAAADTMDESDETVIVAIDSVTNATESGTQSVTTTISDDDTDPTVTLTQSITAFAESGSATNTITATLSGTSGSAVTVSLAFSGTATVTSDYTRSGTSISIPAGSTTGTVTLTSVSDSIFEADETIIVDISSVTNASESGTQQVTSSITEDDFPTVTLSRSAATIAESGSATSTITATLSGASAQTVTVNLSFSGTTTVTSDYTRSATSIAISSGTTGTITLTSVGDSTDESNETIIVDISSVTNGTESGTQTTTVTITDDDAPADDLDEDGVLNTVEDNYKYVPLVNAFGSYDLTDELAPILRGSTTAFKVPTGISTTEVGMDRLIADADDDFDLDSLLNSDETDGLSNLFVGDSNGLLGSRATVSTGNLPADVTVGDYNNDGHLDLASIDAADNTISVFIGNGDGTFSTRDSFATDSGPLAMVSADFDGDNTIDIATASASNDDVTVMLNDGTGDFSDWANYTVGDFPFSIATADFDEDGYMDLVTSNRGTGANGTTISVLLNDGDGTFASHVTYNGNIAPSYVTVGDFDGDNSADIAFTNEGGSGNGTTVSILIGNGDGTFAAKNDYTTNSGPTSLTTGDFDGDGFLDLAITNNSNGMGNTFSVLLNNGDGTFASKVDYATVANDPTDIITFDIDGDNDLDLVYTNHDSSSGSTVGIYEGIGDGTFSAITTISSGLAPYYLSVGDFDEDGILDIVVSNFGSNTLSILFGN